jgi:hypothetical protein
MLQEKASIAPQLPLPLTLLLLPTEAKMKKTKKQSNGKTWSCILNKFE